MMRQRRVGTATKAAIIAGAVGVSALTFWLGAQAAEQGKSAAPAAAAGSGGDCKAVAGGQCCKPELTQHLAKEAIFQACGESPASFVGEKAGKDTCRYVFDGKGAGTEGEAFVEIYAPAQKDVPTAPSDPFFAWKKVGKVFVTEKALSPKSAPMLANATGLWMPGNGYFVSVNASTKVCTKAEAQRLARSLR